MLKEALMSFFVLGLVHSQDFGDFQLADPFQAWNWHSRHSLFPDAFSARDVDAVVTERDREPLDPNYKDPATSGSDAKPVLQPSPTVVDVEAATGGFPGGDFGFSSFGGLPQGGGLFGLGGFFGPVEQFKPWWKGANVCIDREESTDGEDSDADSDAIESKKNETESQIPNFFSTAISLSNCQQSENKYECTTKINNHGVVKTFTVRYKCCYGFARTEGTTGCEKKLNLKTLLETIDDLGAKEFKNLIQTSNLEETFKETNHTLFVPTDQALNDYNEKMTDLNNVDLKVEPVRRRRDPLSTNDLVLSHAVAGFIDLTELSNDDILYSENPNNSTIRINTYPTQNYEKMVTINCARITKANNLAKNGIVHLLAGVAAPATQTIQEIIQDNPKLTHLKTVFENTDSFKNLRRDGHYTVFAPTDDAFDKLEAGTKQKLLQGDSCAISILKHHITSHTVCSCAIVGNATTHNIEGEILNMERTVDDVLLVQEKARIIETDLIGTNGVIHLIDTILIPETALHINDALKNENLTKFNELIELAGLTEEVDGFNNVTVFAPSNEAFEDAKMVKLLDDIKDDKAKLKELILYHTLQGQLQSCEMNNNAVLKSNDHEIPLRLNLYSTLPLFTNVINRATINCARIIGFDQKSCGSVIHEVDKILLPPKETILELIHSDPKYSTLSEILKGTKIEEVLSASNRTVTLLAPTDETFAAIDEADLKTLKEDKDKADQVLRNHILTEVLCCSGVGPQSWGFNSLVPTLAHQHLQVGRTGNHQIRIGRAVVTSCDNMATNGIVHTVNKVLFPQRQAGPNFGGLFLFDL